MPAPYSISDFAEAIPSVLRDDANRLVPQGLGDGPYSAEDIFAPFVLRALVRYSLDKPLECVSDVVGDGTNKLPLPATSAVIFDPASSVIRRIEFPIEQIPPVYLSDSEFLLYQTPTGYKVLLATDAAAQGSTYRVTWTGKHNADGSTVPDADFYAVVDFAASLAADTLASIYVQTNDTQIGADTVNYRTKSQEYLTLSRALRKRYYSHVGIDESATGSDSVAPALVTGNMYLNQGSGIERLLHGGRR